MTIIQRRNRLREYARKVSRKRFRAGRHDCAMFVSGAIKVQIGEDPARGWRSKYSSLKKGREMLAEKGFETMGDLMASLYPEIPVSTAQVGDVVSLEGGNALGVVQGEYIWILRPSGLGTVELMKAERAFEIR